MGKAAPPTFAYTVTGYMPLKWTLDDPAFDQSTDNTNSVCLIRYAEILLNYAEAQEELKNYGGPGLTGYNTPSAPGAVAGVTYVPVGGTNATTLSNGTSGRIYYLNNGHRVWSAYKYLYPIPFSELQLNMNLVQNPGWN